VDNTHTAQSNVPPMQARGMAYLALALTIAVALIDIILSLRGKPVTWPSRALLIALFCVSSGNFVASRRLRSIVSVAGIIFALLAIYGILTR
jgi:hypothetical protein